MLSRGTALLVAALVAAGSSGCALEPRPNLIRLDRLAPDRASAGDWIRITGDGFPAGRSATVEFRGDLFRPGVEPKRDASIRLRGAPEGRNALTLRLDADAERRFTGTGLSAAHTTFVGELRVVFQPGSSGLTEVGGAAPGTRFDVLPSGDVSAAEPPAVPGSRTLTFLGLVAAGDPAGGLRVTEMSPGGHAALAGVREGDRLFDLDGVTVLGTDDLRVRSGARTAVLTVERGSERKALTLDVHGLSPLGSSAWSVPSIALVSLCAFLALSMTRLGAALRWGSRLLEAARPRASHARAPLSRGAAPRAFIAGQIVVLAFLVAALARLAFGRAVVSSDSDFFAGPLGATLALVAFRAAHGARSNPGSPFIGSVSAALRTLCFSVPALLAIVGAVIAGGRFVIAEIVEGQGGLPWRWAAAQNPGLLILALVLAGSALPEADRPALAESTSWDAPGSVDSTPTGLLVRLAEWTYLWVMVAVTVLVFLGGYRVPGVTGAAQVSSRALTIVGALLLLVKVGALSVAVIAARALSRRVLVRQATALWLSYAVPGCFAGVALAAVWATLLESVSSTALADFTGCVMVGSAVIAVSVMIASVKWPRAGTNLAVNPWL